MEKIGIACDHAGYDLKEFLTGYLSAKGFEVFDFGCHSEESCDYPDYAHPMAEALENGEFPRAVGICGSGCASIVVCQPTKQHLHSEEGASTHANSRFEACSAKVFSTALSSASFWG